MKVSKGRMVIFRGASFNGENEHAAVITRDWSGTNADPINSPVCVNLTVFGDCSPPTVFSSVMMYDSRKAADAAGVTYCCFWPDLI